MIDGWMKRNRNYESKSNCSHVNDKRRGIKEKKNRKKKGKKWQNNLKTIKDDQTAPDSFHKIKSTCLYLPSELTCAQTNIL